MQRSRSLHESVALLEEESKAIIESINTMEHYAKKKQTELNQLRAAHAQILALTAQFSGQTSARASKQPVNEPLSGVQTPQVVLTLCLFIFLFFTFF